MVDDRPRKVTIAQWANYRRQADIEFFKIFDLYGFIQRPNEQKRKNFPIFKKKCPKILIFKI
jgi:hypothetical protein